MGCQRTGVILEGSTGLGIGPSAEHHQRRSVRMTGDENYRREMNIAIRSILLRGGSAWVQAGAGVVADSVPEHEYAETVNKARAMFRAIEMAERGL